MTILVANDCNGSRRCKNALPTVISEQSRSEPRASISQSSHGVDRVRQVTRMRHVEIMVSVENPERAVVSALTQPFRHF